MYATIMVMVYRLSTSVVRRIVAVVVLLGLVASIGMAQGVFAAQEQGSVGMEGRISAPPPTQAATISIPRSGQTFSTLPVTVSGICPNGLLVKLFKNNVFGGSTQCNNGSFSLIIDLFDGQNELVARVYDALDQAGPDSNRVTVTYNNAKPTFGGRVSLSSAIAKKGANPGQKLVWPISVSDGEAPYAISVDWGDGKTPDLLSRQFAGNFDIEHVYDNPGVYNIVIKATDKNGGIAYLQLVGVANGALSQENQASEKEDDKDSNAAATKQQILWWPAALFIPFIAATFWLGSRHQLHTLKKKIERGDRPF
jgi:hypothetical protein